MKKPAKKPHQVQLFQLFPEARVPSFQERNLQQPKKRCLVLPLYLDYKLNH